MSAVIAIDLGGTNLRVGLLRAEHVLWKQTVPTGAADGQQAVIRRMCELIAAALQAAEQMTLPVAGIGVGSPGPVNPFTGVVDRPPNLPGWEQVPLASLIGARFALPVYLNNDANAAALGEWRYGAGRGHNHLVYVTLSTGIGGGVVSDGTLLLGSAGGAAEIGHICLQAVGGEPCGCGRSGCFEAYASGTALVRRAQAHLQRAQAPSRLSELPELTPQAIAQVAGQGDWLASRLLAETIHYLAAGLASVLAVYDPAVLILGGGLTNLWSELIAPAVQAMHRLTFAPGAERLLVTRPQLGDDAGLIGAGALVDYCRRQAW